MDALVRFGQEDKFLQFLGQIVTIITNSKIMDNFFVINPVLIRMGKKDWKDVKDIPSNKTALGGDIKISSKSLCTFEKKLAFGSNAKKSGGNTYSLDMMYFTFAMSCDVEQSELISRTSRSGLGHGEWGCTSKRLPPLTQYCPL